ncbi:MAG: hypothetical protein RQ869_03420, partial [Candidatus Nanopusillus sp.]|nr:hypothetical protein [Candidatus Nanopusillus sp.]
NITNTYSGNNNNVNVLRIDPSNIVNINSTSFSISSLNNDILYDYFPQFYIHMYFHYMYM